MMVFICLADPNNQCTFNIIAKDKKNLKVKGELNRK